MILSLFMAFSMATSASGTREQQGQPVSFPFVIQVYCRKPGCIQTHSINNHNKSCEIQLSLGSVSEFICLLGQDTCSENLPCQSCGTAKRATQTTTAPRKRVRQTRGAHSQQQHGVSDSFPGMYVSEKRSSQVHFTTTVLKNKFQ